MYKQTKRIVRQPGRLPKLFSSDARAELMRKFLPVSYTFNPEHVNSRLRLVAAEYDVNGKFEQYINLTDGTLQVCARN